MDRRNRRDGRGNNIFRQLLQQRMEQIMSRQGGGGNRGGGRPDDFIMQARNNKIRGSSGGGIGQQAIGQVMSGNPNLSGLSGAYGTGTTKVRGNGRAYASAEPGSVDIGHVSSDTPPVITINGKLYTPEGGGVSAPPPRQTGVYNPPSNFPPQGQGVGRTTTPTGSQVDPTKYPTTSPQGQGVLGTSAVSQPPSRQTTPPVQVGEASQPGLGGVAPTTNPKGQLGATPPPDGSQGSGLGNRIADVVRNAISSGASQPTTSGGIREMVNQRLMDRGLFTEPGQPPPQPPQPPRPITPATPVGPRRGLDPVPMDPKTGLPVIPSPTELPGSAVSGQSPTSGLPVIQGPTRLPGSAVSGQSPSQPSSSPALAPAMETAASSVPPSTLGQPQGIIPMELNVAFGRGADWQAVNQYDPAFTSAAEVHGVDPAMLKAMAVIESGGQMIENQGGSGAYGIMQIKASDWQDEANRLGYDLNTPEGQIGMAAAILGGDTARTQGMTPEEAFVEVYYPTGCMDCQGEDGHTPRQYLEDMTTLMDIINGSAPPVDPSDPGGLGVPVIEGPTELPADPVAAADARLTTPPPPGADATAPLGPDTGLRSPVSSQGVEPVTATDGMGEMASPESDESWLALAFPVSCSGDCISTEYKQPVTWVVPQLGDCPYCYQNGHGADGSTHAGMDISGSYGDPVSTPVAGTVVCSGGGEGPGVPGFNCSYAIGPTFEDNNGPGQITLDVGTDAAGNQLLINTIHMGGSSVKPGQQLAAGEQIGTMGSMGGMVHTHIEGLAICGGNYYYLDPTLVYNGYYNTHDACAGI